MKEFLAMVIVLACAVLIGVAVILRNWLEKRSRIVSDRPHAMQELIDREMGHQPMAYETRDYYRRLSEIPASKTMWCE